MTDLAFIVDTSDVALPPGRAATPVSADSTGTGAFSGVLGERLQSGLAKQPQPSDSPPQTVTTDAKVVVESGAAEPLDGKPLPLSPLADEPALTGSPQAGPANAALLAAMAQSASGNSLGAVAAVDSSDRAAESAAELLHLSTLSLSAGVLPGGLPNALGEVRLATPVNAQASPSKVAALTDGQLPAAILAKQMMAAKSNGLSLEKQNVHSDNGRAPGVNMTPALLAQPISESAQRALVMAMNDAGLAKRGASNITGQAEVVTTMNMRQAGLSSVDTGLTTASQLAALTSKTVSNAAFEASAAANRVAQPSNATLTTATPVASTENVSDVSGLLSLGPRASATAGSGFMPTMSVATPAGQAGWANEMGQRVAWMVQGELREAQLQLHPRSLGPVEVRIAYGHEQQLNVSFSAANPLAREALDAALPRLREMFEQQGLHLADANISHQSFSDQQKPESEEGEPGSNPGHWSVDSEELAEQSMLSNHLLMGDGMLDAYA